MHIYIDESGIFRNPANKDNVASCVGALAIPTCKKKEIFQKFERLTYRWPKDDGEVKGKLLNEDHINSVVEFLQRYDLLFEINTIDLGIHDETDITSFKQTCAQNFGRKITDRHHPEIRRRVAEMKEVFMRLTNPLFIQAIMMFHLIPRLLYHSIIYYARRVPSELQWFYWMVDAKDQKKTEFENTWATALLPIMTNQSVENPITLVEGGDYSYFEKFEEPGGPFHREIEKEKGLEPNELWSIKLGDVIGKNMTFQNSKYNLGLQIVDVLTNATQRALNGKLDESGWGKIGSLMILREPSPLQFIQITTDMKEGEKVRTQKNSPYYHVSQVYKGAAKSMWLDSASERQLEERNLEKNLHRMRKG